MQSKLSLTFGVLALQALFMGSVTAAPKGVPSSVINLESTAHQLSEVYAREIPRDRRGQPSRDGERLLRAIRALDSSSHNLRSNTEDRRGFRQAQLDVSSVRLNVSQVVEASRQVRLGDRMRGLIQRARQQSSDVEAQKYAIYDRASRRGDSYDSRGRDDHHGHDHDRDDRGRDRDNDRPRLPGALGKIFGN